MIKRYKFKTPIDKDLNAATSPVFEFDTDNPRNSPPKKGSIVSYNGQKGGGDYLYSYYVGSIFEAKEPDDFGYIVLHRDLEKEFIDNIKYWSTPENRKTKIEIQKINRKCDRLRERAKKSGSKHV